MGLFSAEQVEDLQKKVAEQKDRAKREKQAAKTKDDRKRLGNKITGRTKLSPAAMEATHDLDFLLWALQPRKPVRVYSQTAGKLFSQTSETPDHQWVMVTMDDGTTITVGVGWILPLGYPNYVQAWIEVIGTEISEVADRFEHVIRWDFHEVKDEWVDAVDFIYSNSWDHSYDPKRLLTAWMSCLRKGGRLFLHWTADHGESGIGGAWNADCFGASLAELEELVRSLGYRVDAVLHVRGRGRYGGSNPWKAVRFRLWPKRREVDVLVVRHPEASDPGTPR